jgi:hypothetical protein
MRICPCIYKATAHLFFCLEDPDAATLTSDRENNKCISYRDDFRETYDSHIILQKYKVSD